MCFLKQFLFYGFYKKIISNVILCNGQFAKDAGSGMLRYLVLPGLSENNSIAIDVIGICSPNVI